MRKAKEQEKNERIYREKKIQEESKNEADKEKHVRSSKRSLQKQLLNMQLNYDAEVKKIKLEKERQTDNLMKSLNIGSPVADHKDEVKTVLEQQIKEKQLTKLAEVL